MVWNPRMLDPVEANPILKNVFAKLIGGDREMLPQSGHIAELKIDALISTSVKGRERL